MKVESYFLNELHDLQVSIRIKRLIDENKILLSFYEYPDVNH